MGFDQGVVSPCRTTKPGRFWLCLVHRSTHTRFFLKHRRRRRARTRKLDLDRGCIRTDKKLACAASFLPGLPATRESSLYVKYCLSCAKLRVHYESRTQRRQNGQNHTNARTNSSGKNRIKARFVLGPARSRGGVAGVPRPRPRQIR